MQWLGPVGTQAQRRAATLSAAQERLKNCTARSCFSAADLEANVPRSAGGPSSDPWSSHVQLYGPSLTADDAASGHTPCTFVK